MGLSPVRGAVQKVDRSDGLQLLRQAQLLDSLFDVERGLTPSSETGAEINELIHQLEARNPTAAPNEAGAIC